MSPNDAGGPGPYDPCPCGSGKKYKFCCRDRDRDRNGRLELLPFEDMAAIMEDMESEGASDDLVFLEKAAARFPNHGVIRANLAVACYERGEIDRAAAELERCPPGPGVAEDTILSRLVHCRLLQGRVKEAEEIGRRMPGLRPPDRMAQREQCTAMAMLGWHDEVLRRAVEGMERFPDRGWGPDFAFFRGAALANLGDQREAGTFLRLARASYDFDDFAGFYLRLLKKDRTPPTLFTAWPYNPVGDLMPEIAFESLKSIMLDEGPPAAGGPGGPAAALFGSGFRLLYDAALLSTLPAAEKDMDGMAWFLVDLAADLGTEAAVEVLRRSAFGMLWDDELRLSAASSLAELGRIAPGERVRIFIGGRWRRITIVEPGPELPPEALELESLSHESLDRGDAEAAERAARDLVRQAPQSSLGHGLLAEALKKKGRIEEARPALERAARLKPRLIQPRCTLAAMLADEGDLDRAWSLLDGLGDDMWESPFSMAMLALLRLRLYAMRSNELNEDMDAKPAKDIEYGIKRALEFLEILDDEDLEYMLADMPLRLKQHVRSHCRSAAAAAKRSRRLRQRPVAARHGVKEALKRLDEEEILDILRAAGVGRASSLGKGRLLELLVRELGRDDSVGRLVKDLNDEDAAALAAVAAAGGVMTIEDFSERFEYMEGSGPGFPRTSLGRLEARGLVTQGKFDLASCVFIPLTMRPLVERALERGRRGLTPRSRP